MQPFVRVAGRAATFLEADVDTDVIFPARFLLIMEKAGLGRYLFHDRRAEHAHAWPLDDPALAGAPILIAGENFGCGSSREQAVWALAGAGFRCVVAPSLGEIFRGNCLKNGVLPLALPAERVAELAAAAQAGANFAVDLETRRLVVSEPPGATGGGSTVAFELEDAARDALLNGWDEIDLILGAHGSEIARFEARQRDDKPWLFA